MPAAMPSNPRTLQAIPDGLKWYAELMVRMLLDYSNQAVKFLTLANSGGAVALLSFMGNSEYVRSLPSVWIALMYLIAGFVLALSISIINFFTALYLGRRFAARTRAHYSGALSFADVFHVPPWVSWSLIVPITAAALSLGCFVYAAWTAISGYKATLFSVASL